MHCLELKNMAIKLRIEKRLSIKEISLEINVAENTVNNWVKPLKLTAEEILDRQRKYNVLPKFTETHTCEKCGRKFEIEMCTNKKGENVPSDRNKGGKFCSNKCACHVGGKSLNGKKKNSYCSVCKKPLVVGVTCDNRVKCDECRNKELSIKMKCKVCGQCPCIHADACDKKKLLPALVRYFGMDKNKIGTVEIEEEYQRIRELLNYEYNVLQLSVICLQKKYGHKNIGNFCKILYSLGIKLRTVSDGLSVAFQQNRLQSPINTKYKTGWLTSWNNKKFFYRSSYELEYAKDLDELKIDYEMEGLKIKYFDTQRNKFRFALPDFYLPSFNKIIEIKSVYTLDMINMIDKIEAYRKDGYTVEVVVDNKIIDI